MCGTNVTNKSNLELSIELNNKLFGKNPQGKSLELNPFNLLKDNIKNYRPLSEYELLYIEHLTEEQKVEIIKLFNTIVINLVASIE